MLQSHAIVDISPIISFAKFRTILYLHHTFCLFISSNPTQFTLTTLLPQILTSNTFTMASDKLVNGEKPHSVTVDVGTKHVLSHGIQAYL